MTYFNEQDIIQLCIEKINDLFGSSVRLISSSMVGGGCINHAVKLSTSAGDYFLKWNASGASDMFIKEASGLSEMREANNSF